MTFLCLGLCTLRCPVTPGRPQKFALAEVFVANIWRPRVLSTVLITLYGRGLCRRSAPRGERSPLQRVPWCALRRLLSATEIRYASATWFYSRSGCDDPGRLRIRFHDRSRRQWPPSKCRCRESADGQLGRGQRGLAQLPIQCALDHRQHRAQAEATFRLIRSAAHCLLERNKTAQTNKPRRDAMGFCPR